MVTKKFLTMLDEGGVNDTRNEYASCVFISVREFINLCVLLVLCHVIPHSQSTIKYVNVEEFVFYDSE